MESSIPPDAAFLDEILARALEDLADGRPPDVDAALAARPDLRAEVERVIALACRSAMRPLPSSPDVPGYGIVREIARGGMGIVYLARQWTAGGRLVALKVLPPSGWTASNRARFLAEARLLAGFRHPHLVPVHYVVETGSLCAYAMEWIDGEPLSDLIHRLAGLGREPTLDDVRTFLGAHLHGDGSSVLVFLCRTTCAIARALSAVHEAGLIHRDVKPSNILLRRDGTPLLADFGVARAAEGSLQTRTGEFVGTLAYAPPEQLRGETARLDARSDVYALGATLHHALALRLPHVGRSPAELLRAIEGGRGVRLRRANPRVPRDLETIVEKAMDPDPARRYASAADLAEDLDRLVELRPVRARPAGPVERLVKLLRRNRRAAAVGAAGAVLGVVLAGLLTAHLLERADRPRRARERLAEARLLLLDPLYWERIYVAVHGSPDDQPPPPEGFLATLTDAERRLGEAARLEPGLSHAAVEQEAVRRARDLMSRGKAMEPVTDETLERATLVERRTLGLEAFLLGDAALCNRAWRGLDLASVADPLVDASLGLLHLARDDGMLAYPRLQRACDAFPDAGFLVVHLADAAVRAGDLDTAERFLSRAETVGGHDPFDSLKRVRADYHAARGETERARELFQWLRSHHEAPTARFRFARFEWLSGRHEKAIELLTELVRLRPLVGLYRAALVGALARWWALLGPIERHSKLESLLGGEPGASRFLEVLHAYQASLRAPGPIPSFLSIDSPRKSAVQWSPFASLLVEDVSLEELTRRLEEDHMDPSPKNPRPRAFIALSRLPGVLRLLANAAQAFTDARHMRTSTALAIATSLVSAWGGPAQAQTPGGWISEHNGPSNSRRSFGQSLAGGWQQVWSIPQAGGPILEQGGRVVYLSASTPRPDGGRHGTFNCVSLSQGVNLWAMPHVTGPTLAHSSGCIVGKRVFLPLSSSGSGPPFYNQRVECVDLGTGIPAWSPPWSSTVGPSGVGNVSIQALPWHSSMGVPQVNRVVATVSDVSETWYSRLVVLNADAPIPTVMASTGYTSPRWNPIPPTIAPLVNAWRIFNHAQDWDSARFHHSISIDTYDLVLSAQPGFKLSRTTLTTLPNVSSLAPVVSRNGTSVGYLYETGGLLRAYDLQLGTQLWSRNVNAGSPTTTNLYLFPLLLSNQVVLLDNQNGGGVARRWDLLGTRLADVNPLPSAPLSPARASVLDNDIILVPCADGTVRALTASGTSMGPFHTEAYLRDVIATGGHYLVSTGGTNPSLKCYKSVLFNGNAPAMLTRGLPTKLPIASPGDAGFPYVCAFSFGTGPTPLPPPDTRTLPLTPDPLMVCMLSGCGGFVSGHIGVLDAAGNAGVIVTPPAVLPAGLVFHTAYVVLDPAFRTGLRTISQAIPLTTM